MSKQVNPIVRRFAERHPGRHINPVIAPAAETLTVPIRKKHARGAVKNDCFECDIAHAGCDVPGALDAAVQFSFAHILFAVGENDAVVVKYKVTDGARSVIEANDKGNAVWGMSIDLAPLTAPRSQPGAKTHKSRKALPKKVRQSPEHVAKRVEARQKSAGRRLLSA